MNILHLRASNFYGGPERQLHLHAVLAQRRGFNITISSFTEEGRIPEFLQVIERDGVRIHAFDVKSPYDPGSVKKVRRYLAENRIDVLCTHDYRTQVIGFLATRGTPTAWLAFSRGWTAENLKIRLYHGLDKFLIRFADHIIAVSQSQKRKLTGCRIAERRISVAHNAIDVDRIRSVPAIDIKNILGFPSDCIICISGGRFSSEKGQISLVRAAAEGLKKNDCLRFALYGDGPDLARIRTLIRELGLEEKIRCPGFEKNLLGCLRGADILINPSLSEGLPNIVLEGMALGVPVIATAVGGVPELIENQVNGVLVAPGDHLALADAILTLVESWECRDRIVKAAHGTLARSFSFTGQMDTLAEIYNRFNPGITIG